MIGWITVIFFALIAEGAWGAITFRDVNQKIFGPLCVDCHASPNPPANLDLQDYNSVMKSGVVIPGEPAGSKLIHKLESGEMPLAGLPLEDDELALVRQWILDGAMDAAPAAGIALGSVTPRYASTSGKVTVTVEGENLDLVEKIWFGKENCSQLKLLNPKAISCVIPPQVSPMFVAVTLEGNGQTTAVDNAFEYRMGLSPNYQALRINVFGPKCIECHSNKPGKPAPKGFDLASYTSALAHRRAIVPFNLKRSKIYDKVRKGEMPQNGPPLSREEISTIALWIEAGAPEK